jgi:glyceraldehyde 3-phosphate dehydrogenase
MTVKVEGDMISVGTGWIKVFAERDPEEPALGRTRHRHRHGMHRHLHRQGQGVAHLTAGAKRVLVSAPASGADKTIVYGVNHDVLTKDDLVVSNASCTTNCLAPVAKVLNDAIGIEKGMMTTIHSYTGDQPTLDTMHKDLYRGRAAAMSMIPTSTGAAKAVGLVLPELNGKLDGVAIRVPTPNVSVVDLKFIAKRETSVEEINKAMIKAAAGRPAQGHPRLHRRETFPSTSTTIRIPRSSTLDQTKVMDGTLVSILTWYDNEWGFSNRMADTAIAMAKLISIAGVVEDVLDHRVHFAADCIGDVAAKAVDAMVDGDVLLLENTRFHAGEEKNDPDFVAELAKNGDIFVNDAFSAAHRAHASTEGLAHRLPAYAGRTMQAELVWRSKKASATRRARSWPLSAAPRFRPRSTCCRTL